MAELNHKGPLYRVVITEYEAGVQRVDTNDIKIFTTLEEAIAYKDRWEQGGSPECFWRGEIEEI